MRVPIFDQGVAAMKAMIQESIGIERPFATSSDIANLHATAVTAYAGGNFWAKHMSMVRFRVVPVNFMPGDPVPEKPPTGAEDLQRLFLFNFYDVVMRSVLSEKFFGHALLQKVYNPSGYLKELRWLNPLLYRLQLDTFLGLRGFNVSASQDITHSFFLPRPQAVYWHGVDFRNDYDGVSPLEVAFMQAGTETEVAVTQLNAFRNSAIPALVVQPASDAAFKPSKADRDSLVEYIRTLFQGARNSHRTGVVPTRWEFVKLQSELDKMAMQDITISVREGVCTALDIQFELLYIPQHVRAGSGTTYYEILRTWLQTKLVPEAYRYAAIFTDQIASEVSDQWRIEPDFSLVMGLKEDIANRTNTVKGQVADGLLDLYSAQVQLGVPGDVNMKNLNIINGTPVPSEVMKDYYRIAPGTPFQLAGGGQPTTNTDTTKPTKPTDRVKSTEPTDTAPSDGNKSAIYLPDAVHKELRDWSHLVARKGADYAFAAKSLPSDTAAYGRLLLTTSLDSAAAFADIRLEAAKDYGAVERDYRAALYDLLNSAFRGATSRTEFGDLGRAEISSAFQSAFIEGLKSGGVTTDAPDAEEQAALTAEIKAERTYYTALANELWHNVLPLYSLYREDNDPSKYEEFAAARSAMLRRVELFVNKGLQRINQLGVLSAKANQNLKWQLGATEKHCETCKAANGQVHRARDWMRSGVMPQADSLECGGFQCDCSVIPTIESVKGSLATIPRAMKSAEPGHEAGHDHEVTG